MDTDRNSRPSLAALYRDFASRWEIENVPAGTKWVAVLRETDGDAITLVVANNISTLRYRMNQSEREGPAGPA
jgi:hypothetical protein